MFQRANDVSLEVYSDVGDVAEMLLLNSRFMFALSSRVRLSLSA